jgi:lantibiotic modifying enzyme
LQFGSGGNHGLCHGDWGNLDLLVSAAQSLGHPRLSGEARRWAAGLLDAAEVDGWQCATPFGLESAGLMTGLAGIGYGLLRVASPERVPSVLALEPPA